jgi:RecB family exonuclease
MRAWQTCQRGWYLSYYRKLRRVYDAPKLPNIGTFFHGVLERYYNGEDPNPNQWIVDMMEPLIEKYPDYSADIQEAGTMAAIMSEGYFEWLEESGEDANLEVEGAEVGVETDVGPYKLRGKIDARVRRRTDGALLQLEHKTVGNLSDHPKWARQNPQFLTYDLLSFMTKPDGVPTDGILLNMARRVKRTPRAKPPFYGRYEVRHSVEELRKHYEHVVGIGDQITKAHQRLDAGESHHVVCPPAPSRAHLWSCACAPLGSMPDDGSDVEAYLEEFYEWHDPMERYGDKEEHDQ